MWLSSFHILVMVLVLFQPLNSAYLPSPPYFPSTLWDRLGKLKAIDSTTSTSNIYIFQFNSYRNCLPDAPAFYLVCPDHCFFFFCFLPLPRLFHPLLFFFVVLIDTSSTSASFSVCNSETSDDYLTHDSRTSVPLVLVALAETVDWLCELGRELCWRGHWWPITKLTRRWLWMRCWNCSISRLCPHFKKYFSKTTSLAWHYSCFCNKVPFNMCLLCILTQQIIWCSMKYFFHRFPEKHHEQWELSPIGCRPRSISRFPHLQT